MDELKDFKDISHRIMDGISVTPGLKERTLEKCRKKSRLKPVIGVLVPAACVVLAVAALNTTGWLGGNKGGVPYSGPEATIMLEAAQGTEVLPEDSGGDMLKSAPQGKPVVYGSLDLAAKAFGENFLQPVYIPAGFKLTAAEGFPEGGSITWKLVLTYEKEKYIFQITEEKLGPDKQTRQQKELQGYRKIEIGGAPAYVRMVKKAGAIGETEAATEATTGAAEETGSAGMDDLGPTAEILWYGDETLYSVAGGLDEAEVIKVAEAMVISEK